jgi:DNA polymerase-3 subunit gamma/tau
VLARKYRPTTFTELIGQAALVRILTNAIQLGKLAHAFVLNGVQGIGKTSTARIISKALNCIGADGRSQRPTLTPCQVCDPCRAITADRHIDVIEMDAASNNSIDDIREITKSVHYAPVAARYKVYIIDEAHMLSAAAFNSLLKTLEEPPPHTKFIFATTEIRKIPLTILSRCQRLDLHRVKADVLVTHFSQIAAAEQVEIEESAITTIARVSNGSVRDGLSLLDQAIAFGNGTVTSDLVRTMLGLADRSRIIDLFEVVIQGKAAEVLSLLSYLYHCGADPQVILRDLLELTHSITRIQMVPTLGHESGLSEIEYSRCYSLSKMLTVPVLTRLWQGLLKGLNEVQQAPVPSSALEMVLIRLVYVAGLPTPGDLLHLMSNDQEKETVLRSDVTDMQNDRVDSSAALKSRSTKPGQSRQENSLQLTAAGQQLAQSNELAISGAVPQTFQDFVALFSNCDDPVLYSHLWSSVHPIRYQPGFLEIRLEPTAPKTLAGQIMEKLKKWTGQPWIISLSQELGEPTLAEQNRTEKQLLLTKTAKHPLVQAVLEAFPGAKLGRIREVL